jgi:hypothetical protein
MFSFRNIAILLVLLGIVDIIIGIRFGLYVYNIYQSNNVAELNNLSNIGQFLSGTVGILTSAIVSLIIFSALIAQMKQSFENTFFQLLKSYENIVNNLNVSDAFNKNLDVEDQIYNGKNAFKEMFKILSGKYFDRKKISPFDDDKTEPPTEEKKKKMLKVINESYLDFDKEFQPYIGYYFRDVYYILKLTNKGKLLTKREKHFYVNILRANLSAYELLLLFYNSLSDRGKDKVNPLIEKYQFLKHIEIFKNLLIDIEKVDHTYLYKKSAFKKYFFLSEISKSLLKLLKSYRN